MDEIVANLKRDFKNHKIIVLEKISKENMKKFVNCKPG
jgi:hypothetical protein